MFNQIRHIQEIGNKLISLPTKSTTPDHIGEVLNISLRYEWYDSIFSNYEKWQHPQPSVHHFYAHRYHETKRYSDPEYLLG